jgi:hypothetical protein
MDQEGRRQAAALAASKFLNNKPLTVGIIFQKTAGAFCCRANPAALLANL